MRNKIGMPNGFKDLRPEIYVENSQDIYDKVARKAGLCRGVVLDVTNALNMSQNKVEYQYHRIGCDGRNPQNWPIVDVSDRSARLWFQRLFNDDI